MNISGSYNRNQSFGMAFRKPNQFVLNHFEQAIKELPEKEREFFTEKVGYLVEQNKNISVPIEQTVTSTGVYKAVVANTAYFSKEPKTKADGIVIAMEGATNAAKNLENANSHFAKIKKIFDM
ncbi:TPA: hypothetical protein CPT80_04700 [Candidatus Gastranaerophilales bacterium HUM_9]|nr:MAG TPA: hypothetical protein CPT80_04700 [Candidatus Gastranaerophilales bacterium HUM_9]HBX34520.1 hypothetical protein [Cyanobacteria bacterium UBA11440]